MYQMSVLCLSESPRVSCGLVLLFQIALSASRRNSKTPEFWQGLIFVWHFSIFASSVVHQRGSCPNM